MTAATATASRSVATERAVAFVAARKARAETQGAALAEHVGDPDAFAIALRTAFEELSDPEYRDGVQFIAPGIGTIHGVRRPLMAAIARGFRRETRHDRATTLLFLADRLFHEPHLEARWFAFGLLERTLAADPERTWQLLRRAAREAGDWVTVDDLAHPYATGIAAEPYRWAELEQLVYSPSRWERRLIGSTIATMTHGDSHTDHGPELVPTALTLLEALMGDAEPDVQKALAWAYRSLAQRDLTTTTAALRHEADLAIADADGHRAWVVRDSLSKLAPADAADLRSRLATIRKRPGARSTSEAAMTAERFGALPDPITHPEPPLT
jgi:3-methyladenine DNA glycosylase AlkD